MAQEPNSDNSGNSKEPYATSSTVAYIKDLHVQLIKAKAKLAELEATLLTLKAQKDNSSRAYQRITEYENNAKSQLKQAEQAQESVQDVLQFLQTQTQTARQLVEDSHDIAQAAFVSAYQLKEEGLKRIDEIKQLVVDAQAAAGEIEGDQISLWSPVFSREVINVDAQGVAAFKAGNAAVQKAFKTYLSNYKIYAKTNFNLRQFTELVADLQAVVHSKQREMQLINQQYSTLNEKEKSITSQIADFTERADSQSFVVAQLQAEFHAAQLGAQYTYIPPPAT